MPGVHPGGCFPQQPPLLVPSSFPGADTPTAPLKWQASRTAPPQRVRHLSAPADSTGMAPYPPTPAPCPPHWQAAFGKVRADKLREVQDGHDGTWVAHPGLIPVAKEVR